MVRKAISIVWAFLLLGCGSIIGEGEEDRVMVTAVSNAVGVTGCYGCHADAATPPGLDVVAGDSSASRNAGIGWLTGPHGNYESMNQAHQQIDLGPGNAGFPSYDDFDDETCQGCHDQLGDGRLMDDFYSKTGVDAIGRVERPVVGCESCHGGGLDHFGTTPVPYARPDASRCGQCHTGALPDDHLTYHPEADKIYEDYLASPHARSINDHTYVSGSTTDVRGVCSRCHTDEGAGAYIGIVNGTETYGDLKNALTGVSNMADATDVQCRTCHDPHNPLRLFGEKAIGLPEAWSAEFKTCTACHQLLKADGTPNGEAYHDPDVNPYGSAEEIITDTHFDDPATSDIEGYIVNVSSSHSSSSGNSNAGACIDCHNPHNADNAINAAWANSAHAGFIGIYGIVNKTVAQPWTDRNWRLSSNAACQRCHTATGFRNIANSQDTYNPSGNFFTATGNQAEVLYCWACHTDNAGGTRRAKTGGVNGVIFNSGDVATLGDASDLCMLCHQGRESGVSVQKAVDARDTHDFINIHYFPTAAVMFGSAVNGGYEYSGKTYAGKNTFAGHAGERDTCIKCHMRLAETSTADHNFLPELEDCSTCHVGITKFEDIRIFGGSNYDGDSASEGLRGEIETLETSLIARIQTYATATIGNSIVYDGVAYPYFFYDIDGDGVTDSNEKGFGNRYRKFDDKLLKAAYNYQVSRKEPCGYLHNHRYIVQLLIDSIEDLGGSIESYTRP
jgi:hypothetical protein